MTTEEEKLSVNEVTQDHFDEFSKDWSNFYDDEPQTISHLDLQVRRKNALAHLSKAQFSGKETKILDLGCGNGDAIKIFDIVSPRSVYATDFSEEMVKSTVRKHPEVSGYISDATKLPLISNEFQLVLSLGVLEYIQEFRKALEEVRRTLDDNGVVILSIPNKSSIFRQLRRLEVAIARPLKTVFARIRGNEPPRTYFHQQWTVKEFEHVLSELGFKILGKNYCTSGFLTPRLEKNRLNLNFCRRLNEKHKRGWFLSNRTANTVVIYAKCK